MRGTTGNNLRPGEKAPVSGKFEIIGPQGTPTGQVRYVTAGDPMPPTPGAGHSYIIVEQFETTATSAASTAVLIEATEKYRETLKRLAEE